MVETTLQSIHKIKTFNSWRLSDSFMYLLHSIINTCLHFRNSA